MEWANACYKLDNVIYCSVFKIKIIFTTPELENLKHSKFSVINNIILMKTMVLLKGFNNVELFNI